MIKKISLIVFCAIKCYVLENELETDNEKLEIAKVESSASYKINNKACCFDKRCFYIEALPGYYYPVKKRLREIFGTGGFSGQLDTGYFFCNKLAFFLRGGAYWDNGKSTVLKNKTKITLGNITFGLKYVVPIVNRCHFYVGGGGRVFFLRVKNDSDFVQRKVSANKLGGAFVTGFWLYPFRCPLFLDLFLDYSFYKFKFNKPTIASERSNLDVSGPTVGLGLGYQF